jgi:hypothetical protein
METGSRRALGAIVSSTGRERSFYSCRSLDQQAKEQAMHKRFEHHIEEGLERIANNCRRSSQKLLVIPERVGKLMGQNTRSAGLFHVHIKEESGSAQIGVVQTGFMAGIGSLEPRLLNAAQ